MLRPIQLAVVAVVVVVAVAVVEFDSTRREFDRIPLREPMV